MATRQDDGEQQQRHNAVPEVEPVEQLEKGGGVDYSRLDRVDLGDKVLNAEARQATAAEHELSLWQALRTYKRAALWSVLISMTVVMEGYDTTLLSSFYGYPMFRQKYGTWLNEESGYQISSSWQQSFNGVAAVGNIIGALMNGYLTARYGHRRVIMGSLVFLAGFVFMAFFAPTIEVQLAGQFFCNIPWGVFATTGPAYAAEVAPLALRGHLTAYINMCWVIGQLISAGVLKGLVNNETEWSYKIPFAVQWVWPVPLMVAAYVAPESPWYLVRQGQLAAARRSLERLSEPEHRVDYDAALALMVHTNKLEEQERAGVNYWDAFRGTNRQRTEIACMSFLSHITNGGALAYNGAFFYQQTGIDVSSAYAIGLAGMAISFVGVVISWIYIQKFGRRTIWLVGFYGMDVVLFTIGILACVPQTSGLAWGQSALCLVWLGVYSMTVGPIVYTIVAEIGSTRLRTQTVVLGRTTYYLANIIGGILHPKFMAPDAWNAKGKTAFFWGSLAVLTTIWGFFRLPETKDRTFAEMDFMFQKGVPARKFASYQIDVDEEFVTH